MKFDFNLNWNEIKLCLHKRKLKLHYVHENWIICIPYSDEIIEFWPGFGIAHMRSVNTV
jgi:hypothetical protein